MPPAKRGRPLSTIALALLTSMAGLAACDPAPAEESAPAMAEPSEALRPVAQRGEVPEDARIVDYRIEARLDERSHEIQGTLRMVWRNRTGRGVDRLPFHLYMNGFRAEDTAWMASARGSHRGEVFARDRWGFVDVSQIRLLQQSAQQDVPAIALEQAPGTEARSLRYSEDADPSTMTVFLDQPVGPGEAVVLELDFLTRLPQVFARTGYYGDFHMAGQWFPKIGVLEEDGGWQAHTFSLFSEFYADFGDYEVFLDVPEDYVVGATGILVDGHAGAGAGTETTEAAEPGRKRLHYQAQMVHDFAWVADPDFVERWGEYEGIRIRQLIQPEHAHEAQLHLDAQLAAFASMEARFGPYPWSTITIVHAPKGAEGAGGMEYPTLYTTSNIASKRWIPRAILDERLSGVFTTVHEFGHQYFQGLFASNEHAQPWLDEGMNTTANQLVYWDAYGDDPWVVRLLGMPLTTKDILNLSMLGRGDVDPIDQPADAWDPAAESYGTGTYQKTGAVMLTLREIVGREPWDRALASYAAQARFRHPDGFMLERALVAEIGGESGRFELVPGVELDVQAYLDWALREADLIDLRLLEVGNRRRLGDAGWHRLSPDEPLPPEPPVAVLEAKRVVASIFDGAQTEGPPGWTRNATDDDWGKSISKLADEQVEGYVLIQRRSAAPVPVEILVEFADGSAQTLVWEGREPHERFDFPGRRVERAVIDPNYKLIAEPRRLDNARWADGAGEKPDDALAGWVGDVAEAVDLAAIGGLGI